MDWLEAVVLAAAAGTGTYVNDRFCLNFKGPLCPVPNQGSLKRSRRWPDHNTQHPPPRRCTGWAAATRLLSSPQFDFSLLLGMALGASLVILLLKARGQDVFVPASAASARPAATTTTTTQAARAAAGTVAASAPHLPREASLGGRGASGGSRPAPQHQQQQQQQAHQAGAANARPPAQPAAGLGSSGGGSGPIGMLRRLSSHAGAGRKRRGGSMDGSGSHVRSRGPAFGWAREILHLIYIN